MARAKKETALTPEERLQAALVPDWEWPYKLPENWCWTKIGSISSLHRGVSYKKTDAHTERRENSCLVMRGGNICEGSIDTEADNIYVDVSLVAENQIVRKNDIIIVASTGSTKVIGRAGISKMDYLDVAFGAFLLLVRPSTKVNQRYIDYFFLSDNYRNRIKKLASGININNIRGEYITETLVPLAPLAEQQRIVDRIESLFTKLDEAKEKAQAVVDSFRTRKAAILHKAFTGELTAKWREEHGVRMDSWEVRTLDSVCSSIFDGDHMPPPKAESGIPFLVISNVNTGHLTFENTRFVPQEYYDTLSDTRKPQLGDVLYTLVGSFGIPVVVNSKRPFCFQRHMALLRPIDVSSQFLWYILQTPEMYDKASSIATGTAQLTVPIKGLRAMTIPRPNIAEQVEIVRILDGFFAREQFAKEAAEAVLDQIDLMKKSILARAFRGELGTNDPSEESAVELLKQLI